jgi:hypothetical protein
MHVGKLASSVISTATSRASTKHAGCSDSEERAAITFPPVSSGQVRGNVSQIEGSGEMPDRYSACNQTTKPIEP